MLERAISFSLTQRVFVCVAGLVLMFSGLYAFHILDVVAYPEDGYAWVATRDPDLALLAKGGDPGIIARFEIPIE